MLSLSARAIKYYLFLINFIFAITGVILIAVGTAIKAEYEGFNNVVEGKFFSAPIFLIVIGSIIFFISSLGCCGAIKESRFLIILFSTLLGIILILEMILVLAGFFLAKDAKDLINESFDETMKTYNTSDVSKREWDEWQIQLKCCGANNASDWLKYLKDVPNSCCSPLKTGEVCTIGSRKLHKTGCVTALSDALKGSVHTIEIAVFIISVIHVLSIICACKLSGAIKASRYESV